MDGIECGLTEGLGLYDAASLSLLTAVKMDLDALLKMDTNMRYTAYKTAISAGWLAPNEARRRENMPPVEGGETPYLQQQNYSLAALARRDAAGPAPSGGTGGSSNTSSSSNEDNQQLTDDQLNAAKQFLLSYARGYLSKAPSQQRECA